MMLAKRLAAVLLVAACVGELGEGDDRGLVAAIERAERVDPSDLEGLELELNEVERLAEGLEESPELAARVDRLKAALVDGRARRPELPEPPLPVRVELEHVPPEDLPSGVLAAGGPACLGKNEWNEEFGSVFAAGDFDGDGFEDLAVGVPKEELFRLAYAGQVYVYRGSATGLSPWFRLTQTMSAEEQGDNFGAALAAGDYDGDGYHDLAVGAPYEDVGAIANSGYIFTFRGGPGGLVPWSGFGQTLGANETDDRYGEALAAGDFDGDGRDDLAIASPGEDTLGVVNAGYLFVYRGGAAGLTGWFGLHHQSIGPVLEGEFFGKVLTVGDWHGDGRDDLAVGAPYLDDGKGAVWAFASATAAPHKLVGMQRLEQPGTGAAEAGDFFGQTLAAGDFDGDGRHELAVGAPSEDLGGKTDAGQINVFRLYTKVFPDGEMAKVLVGSAAAIVPDALAPAAANSRFAQTLHALDLNGDGRDDLTAARENLVTTSTSIPQAGQVFVYRGTTTGLVGWGTRDQAGLGTNEGGDWFGDAIGGGDFDGDGRADLVVGAPGERPGSDERSGLAFLYRGQTGTSLPAPWATLGQEADGCTPTWPTPPTIELVERSHDWLKVRFAGDATTTWISYADVDYELLYGTVAGAEVVKTYTGLPADTEQCFRSRRLTTTNEAWSDFETRCFRTAVAPPPAPEVHDWTLWLERLPIVEGYVPYVGTWGPVTGATMTAFRVGDSFLPKVFRFLKPGRTTAECWNPDAGVDLWDGDTATPAQMTALFGTSTPTVSVSFVACLASSDGSAPSNWPITVTYLK